MRNILFIKGKSQYDSTMIFMDGLIEVCREKQIQTDILDSYDADAFARLRAELPDRHYDVVFAMNGMLLEKDSALGKELLRDGTIYCTMLMDHPTIHHERMSTDYPYCFILSPDMYHVECLEKYYPNIWCEAFLAHGGCRAEQVIPYAARGIDISFMGSYRAPETVLSEIKGFPQQMQGLYTECIEMLKQDTSLTLERAVRAVLLRRGLAPKDADFASLLAEFRIVDKYIRAYYRDLVVRTLVEAGIAVDVYGDGWEDMELARRDCLRLHGRVSFRESLEIVADSKISVNVMPWFKAGSHDRVFSSMLCGSICLTDASEYLEEQFCDGRDIVFYSLDEIGKLPERVRELLQDDETAERIAAAGQMAAESFHTWHCRGEELLEYLQTVEQGFCGFRGAEERDRELLYHWANDKEVRAESFHTGHISWEEHTKWFARKMSSPDCTILIWNENGKDCGVLRLEREEDCAYVSYSVGKELRGRGIGKKMIGMLPTYIKEAGLPVQEILAEVKKGNVPSRKIFKSCGYSGEEKEDRILFRYRLMS